MDDKLLVEQREHGIVEAVDTKQVLNVAWRMQYVHLRLEWVKHWLQLLQEQALLCLGVQQTLPHVQ